MDLKKIEDIAMPLVNECLCEILERRIIPARERGDLDATERTLVTDTVLLNLARMMMAVAMVGTDKSVRPVIGGVVMAQASKTADELVARAKSASDLDRVVREFASRGR